MTLEEKNIRAANRFFLLFVMFLLGMWLGEHQETTEEKVSKRFKWEVKKKLSLDQLLWEASKNEK